MNSYEIAEIGVDDKGQLYVAPKTKTFLYIYREAMEIHWNNEGRYLFAPSPPRANLAKPIWWFNQIMAAAKKQSCELRITPETKWHNVPQQLKEEIVSALGATHA